MNVSEIFKPIPNHNGYEVSNRGNVYSYRKNKWMKLVPDKDGYRRVEIRSGETPKTWPVHRLVMLAFVGSSDLQVNHRNGVKYDNRLENLEYATPSENLRHAMYVLGKHWGHKPRARMTEEEVRIAKKLFRLGMWQRIIASLFGVKRQQISKIVLGQNWPEIT